MIKACIKDEGHAGVSLIFKEYLNYRIDLLQKCNVVATSVAFAI